MPARRAGTALASAGGMACRKLPEVALDSLADVRGGECTVQVYEAYQPGLLAWLGGARARPRMLGISGNPADCYSEKALRIDAENGGVRRHGAVVLADEVRPQYRAARARFLGR